MSMTFGEIDRFVREQQDEWVKVPRRHRRYVLKSLRDLWKHFRGFAESGMDTAPSVAKDDLVMANAFKVAASFLASMVLD